MPYNAPFCNVDLNPKWSYDLDKAVLLNCPTVETEVVTETITETETVEVETAAKLSTGAIVAIAFGVIIVLAMAVFMCRMIEKEKAGQPMFAPPKNGGEQA